MEKSCRHLLVGAEGLVRRAASDRRWPWVLSEVDRQTADCHARRDVSGSSPDRGLACTGDDLIQLQATPIVRRRAPNWEKLRQVSEFHPFDPQDPHANRPATCRDPTGTVNSFSGSRIQLHSKWDLHA